MQTQSVGYIVCESRSSNGQLIKVWTNYQMEGETFDKCILRLITPRTKQIDIFSVLPNVPKFMDTTCTLNASFRELTEIRN